MTSYQPEPRHRGLAMTMAIGLALAGAALTLWLGVTGGRAFVKLAGRDDVQLSPIPGLLFVIASVFLLRTQDGSPKLHRHLPPRTLRALALFCILFGLGLLALPFATAS